MGVSSRVPRVPVSQTTYIYPRATNGLPLVGVSLMGLVTCSKKKGKRNAGEAGKMIRFAALNKQDSESGSVATATGKSSAPTREAQVHTRHISMDRGCLNTQILCGRLLCCLFHPLFFPRNRLAWNYTTQPWSNSRKESWLRHISCTASCCNLISSPWLGNSF